MVLERFFLEKSKSESGNDCTVALGALFDFGDARTQPITQNVAQRETQGEGFSGFQICSLVSVVVESVWCGGVVLSSMWSADGRLVVQKP